MSSGIDHTAMPAVALISGRGSNLQAIIDQAEHIGIRLVAVISNTENAQGLQRARDAGIATEVVESSGYPDRQHYDQALRQCIDRYQPKLIILAGFMRILSEAFVDHYHGRLLNIHPALLPAYRGLDTHRRVLDADDKQHGCTVHFVTAELDGGPIIAQARIAVLPDDNEASLAARVLQQEHQIYPLVISWFATGRLRQQGDQALLDDHIIGPHGANGDSLGNAA